MCWTLLKNTVLVNWYCTFTRDKRILHQASSCTVAAMISVDVKVFGTSRGIVAPSHLFTDNIQKLPVEFIRKTLVKSVESPTKMMFYISMSGTFSWTKSGEGGWLVIFRFLSPFCSLNFVGLFQFLKKFYQIIFIIIVFRLGYDRPAGLILFAPTPLFCPIVLFHSCCSHAWVFGKTLVHEFPVSYSHTE